MEKLDFKPHPTAPCEVSKCGVILNSKGKTVSPYLCGGNLVVKLNTGQIRRSHMVARLVWETWRGEIPAREKIKHRDGDRRNNWADNLERVAQ